MGYIKMPLLLFPGTFIFMQAGETTSNCSAQHLMVGSVYVGTIPARVEMIEFPEAITAAFLETKLFSNSGWAEAG